MTNKTALRKKYTEKRQALSSEEIEEYSMAIANRCLALPIWKKTYYHIYLSMVKKKEINTEYLLHILQGRDKSIVVPKANFDTGKMTSYLLQENTPLVMSPYGIPEPSEGIEIPSTQIEVVFLPLLAFDEKGNRLGYGKGFYDKFLATCTPSCLKVGLSFFDAEKSLEISELDVPLDYCITPFDTYDFLNL